MTLLKEILKESPTANEMHQFLQVNNNNEGNQLLNVKGDPVKNTTYIGAGSYVKKIGSNYTITHTEIFTGKTTQIEFTSEQFKHLKNI
jgi:hypothetical protein